MRHLLGLLPAAVLATLVATTGSAAPLPQEPAERPAAAAEQAETPAAETPAAETPAAETPAAETPAAETPRTEYRMVIEGSSLPRNQVQAAVAESLEGFAREGRDAFVDDAAFELTLLLRRTGHPFAQVSFEVDRSQTPVVVRFTLDEGPRTSLGELRFEGNASYSSKELRTFFDLDRTGLLGTGESLYVKSRVESGAAALQSFYRSSGFLDAEVAEPETLFSDDRRRADVLVRVSEGPRYRLRRVLFEGELLRPEAELDRQVQDLLGQSFGPQTPFEIRGRLQEFYGKRGYPDANLDTDRSLDPETASAELTVHVDAGPQVTISDIRIEGELRTRPGLIRSRLTLDPGDVYSSEEERQSFRRLYRMGLFRTVRLSLDDPTPETEETPAEGPGGAAEERTLVISVTEDNTRELFVEPGYGSYERLRLRIGGRRKNLWGTGSELRTEAVISERANRLLVVLSTPYLLGGGVITDGSLEYNRREREGFTLVQYSTGVALRRSWTDRLSSSLGYEFRRTLVRNVSIDLADLPDLDRDLDIAALRLTTRFDDRDNLFVPSRGGLAEISGEYAAAAIGSQLEFLRGRLTLEIFYQLREGLVVGAAWRTGIIAPIGADESIPLQERFFSGGENSVRAFRQDELGPLDDSGRPIGGESFSTISVELRQRLFDGLQGAVFVDAGNVQLDASAYNPTSDLRTGYGVGLRYLLPVGPLRLDGAWKTDPQPGEDTFVLHFSVGMAF